MKIYLSQNVSNSVLVFPVSHHEEHGKIDFRTPNLCSILPIHSRRFQAEQIITNSTLTSDEAETNEK